MINKNWINWEKDENKIRKAVQKSNSKTETLKCLGYYPNSISRAKLNKSIKQFKIDTSHFSVSTERWNTLPNIIKTCFSLSDVLKAVGLKNKGDNHKTAKRIIKEMNLDISHFKKAGNISPYTYENIFIENSQVHRKTLKTWLLKNNLLIYECAFCKNIGQWNNKSLNLEIDHINGINNDNRIKNLRWLCPNCHSQTETFGAKNILLQRNIN